MQAQRKANEAPMSVPMIIEVLSECISRVCQYAKHALLAYNTKGEGIHSPYLFYLIRMVSCDENAYYVWRDIEQQRMRLLRDEHPIHVTDYGTGSRRDAERRVCDLAKHSLEQPRMAQLFFRWLVFLSREAKHPLQIVELGTSLGITTAYLASAHSANRVTTFEGCPATAKVAADVWRALQLYNISTVEGNINSTLATHLPEQVDFAFVDANHTEEATLRYVNMLLSCVQAKSIIVIDDIHYSEEMERAWKALQALPQVTTTMDFFYAGALFFDPHYLKKHYRLRISC